MAAIMVGGVLTGCGSEKEVIEPKNDEVVVEESTNIDVEENSGVTEETTVNTETQVENKEVAKSLVKVLCDMSQNEELSVDGRIPVYTAKMIKAEDAGVNEDTMFNIILYGISESMDESTIAKAFLDESKSISTTTLKEIAASKNTVYSSDDINDNHVGFLIINDLDSSVHEPIANAIVANKNETDEVAHLVAYFGNNIEYIDVNGARYAIFKTETLEMNTEYVYYTALRISNDISDGGIRLFTSYNDEDVNDESIYNRISNRGGLTNCDPSVNDDAGNIKTLYKPDVDGLFE